MTDTQLRYFELYASGHTITEIAKICGKGKSTVSTAIKAAKAHKETTKFTACRYHNDCFTCPFRDCIIE